MIARIFKNPIAKKRYNRFREVRRAYLSFWILVFLYIVSLCSEVICNNIPLYVRLNGKSYFPLFRYYPEDAFLENGKKTRPDYKNISRLPVFTDHPENYILFPVIPFSPFESIEPSSVTVPNTVTMILNPAPMVGTVNITETYHIRQSESFDSFSDSDNPDIPVNQTYLFPDALKEAVVRRFENRESPSASFRIRSVSGRPVTVSLPAFAPRQNPPRTVRLTFRDAEESTGRIKIVFDPSATPVKGDISFWNDLPDQDREELTGKASVRFSRFVDNFNAALSGKRYTVSLIKEEVRFPYKPVAGHIMGIDSAGRDVFARVLYGFRTSLTFGLLLVICSYVLGITAGAVQGYYGGTIDMTAQRLIEIWSALPFLYIMILMGSVYGRSFSLLLFCYGIFNWIGISYYVRAEFLRLRKQAFIEAARCMGLSSGKIIVKHILPNALVPVITFFPFSLVGAIGSLAALDYLGFGLPSPTPSWGELLFQAQQYRWAWWLILYPSLALFFVMLFGVFIGEGIRNAYDPRRYTRLE